MRPVCSHRVSQLCLDGSFLRSYRLRVRYLTNSKAAPHDRGNPNRTFSSGRVYGSNTSDGNTNKLPRWNRIDEIKNASSNPYPRLAVSPQSTSCEHFRSQYNHIQPNETLDDVSVFLYGRIRSQRTAGSKLVFFDLWQDGHKVQILCNQRILGVTGVSPERFREFYHLLQRGDVYSITGKPHRTGRGELTLLASELPTLLSPCLHDVPVDTKEHAVSPYERHVQFLADPGVADILRARSSIVQHIRNFFLERRFIEVNTPIIAAAAGGAIARPFHTTASESVEQLLALRIAPELWLKRLIVGGFDRIFEIGPSFRNEGLDKTHNPEFTTCEFYQAFADLECLMQMTETLLSGLSQNIRELNEKLGTLHPIYVDFSTPFRRIDFVPALESAMGHTLPDLKSDGATLKMVELLNTMSIPLPDHVSLPRLLDKLCAVYLEPQCKDPTFIINHPECMSPLSKSYIHPTCSQVVSARAELFVEGKEVVNTYEEENSPFEQRRKFEEQLSYRDPENPGELDESYLQALEWGLPPTGGWGCGIDRLCMLFTGARRIGDVLSFGNLRSVTRPHTSVYPRESGS
ncbi:lysyl-tRNA synthetase [Coccidioides immitis RMSCC 3703]|uniref:Lysyl-tRNA synthetase n=2 Tax=Coccidioides immitis TaxID=5501 RepID=A0A0J8TUY5_COCIT|nr:lysyl-tRNA synthetase [Coccidioides immitis RMSCC 2394]KMU77632.1 lysyl-tRNA synthetase [Coccidioides immitis RMSCC 3703]